MPNHTPVAMPTPTAVSTQKTVRQLPTARITPPIAGAMTGPISVIEISVP